MAAGAVLAGLRLASAYKESEATRRQADQEELNAELDARVLEQNARLREKAGEEEYRAFRRKAKQILGEQKAAYAASGIDVNYGSALNVSEQTELELELDANTIKNNATLEAFGIRNKANQMGLQSRVEAQGLRAKAGNKMLAGVLDAGINAYEGMGKIKVPKSDSEDRNAYGVDYGLKYWGRK